MDHFGKIEYRQANAFSSSVAPTVRLDFPPPVSLIMCTGGAYLALAA